MHGPPAAASVKMNKAKSIDEKAEVQQEPNDPVETAPGSLGRGLKRDVLTLLLFFHLFAVFVGVVGNRPTSRILRMLNQAPGPWPYLQAMGLDLSYRFDFTQGTEEDRGWRLEADFKKADGTTGSMVLPDPNMKWPIRQRRYYALVRLLALLDENRQAVLAQSIGARLLEEEGAQQLTLRLQSRGLLTQDEVRQDRDPLDPQFLRNEYEARITKMPNGRYLFIKIEKTGESAPTATPKS